MAFEDDPSAGWVPSANMARALRPSQFAPPVDVARKGSLGTPEHNMNSPSPLWQASRNLMCSVWKVGQVCRSFGLDCPCPLGDGQSPATRSGPRRPLWPSSRSRAISATSR